MESSEKKTISVGAGLGPKISFGDQTILVLSRLTCINTYIKYVTERSHKKIVNYVKSRLASIVGAEQFTGP